jgi:hypothetical protein
MTTDFQVSGLPLASFLQLFSLSDTELAARGIHRRVADSKPGYPCRVSLVDADIGEPVLLLHHEHHPVASPYRDGGPIYIRLAAKPAALKPNEIPEVVRSRFISLRAFDAAGFLVGADIADGAKIESPIRAFLVDPAVAFIHLHNAKPGCYSCRVDRAS